MHIVLLAILLACAVAAIVMVFGYRKGAIILVAVAALTAVILIWYSDSPRSQKSLISEESLKLTDLVLHPPYRDTYRVSGRLLNDSEHGLSALNVTITVSDCDTEKQCIVIGEQTRTIEVSIPAGQARDIEEHFQFPGLAPKGVIQLDYQLNDMRSN